MEAPLITFSAREKGSPVLYNGEISIRRLVLAPSVPGFGSKKFIELERLVYVACILALFCIKTAHGFD
jgi:hypothetical protein